MTKALFETEVGNINIEFFSNDAPNTVNNFTKLISDGFYDGLAFHRVIPGFMAQGGCPNTRDGASGMPGTGCLLYTSPSPRDISGSRMPSSA